MTGAPGSAAGAGGAGGQPAGEPDPAGLQGPVRVFLRPIANPFALGFLALAGATLVLAGQELGWIPARQSHQVALIILLVAPPLQIIASLFGFLGRDAVAATGMGMLAATWAVIGAVHLVTHPGGHSQALGTFLFLSTGALLLTAVSASLSKLVPALVMGLTALRFFVTGLYQVLGVHDIEKAGAALGCLLAVAAVYAAFATELEAAERRTVLPVGRRGPGRLAVSPNLADQTAGLTTEPGVRRQL